MNCRKDVKILHIATIDVGGSYKAMQRLNEMLCEQGFSSKILVRTKTCESSVVYEAFNSSLQKILSKVKNIINLIYKKGEVKRDVLGSDIRKLDVVKEADILVIHWISSFLSPKEIYFLSQMNDKKVFFVLHDMWLFTGGCHVDRRCGGYTHQCIACPMAGNAAHRSFLQKCKYIGKSNISITGPSRWIVEEAKKSLILEQKNVLYMPNVYNSKVFYPCDNRNEIRDELSIPLEKNAVLIGAADKGTKNRNKGFSYLYDALDKLDKDSFTLVVIGNSDPDNERLNEYDVLYMGFVNDESKLAKIYSACDIFVNPSLQESFGYTVCEAMACGTPCVAFAVGGMLDQIVSKENGYLAEFCNTESLAEGIKYTLQNREILSANAAKSALRFSYDRANEKIISVLTE